MTTNLFCLIQTLERQISINPKNNMKRVKDAIAYFNLDFSNIKKPATYAFAGFNLALALPKSSIGVSAV